MSNTPSPLSDDEPESAAPIRDIFANEPDDIDEFTPASRRNSELRPISIERALSNASTSTTLSDNGSDDDYCTLDWDNIDEDIDEDIDDVSDRRTRQLERGATDIPTKSKWKSSSKSPPPPWERRKSKAKRKGNGDGKEEEKGSRKKGKTANRVRGNRSKVKKPKRNVRATKPESASEEDQSPVASSRHQRMADRGEQERPGVPALTVDLTHESSSDTGHSSDEDSELTNDEQLATTELRRHGTREDSAIDHPERETGQDAAAGPAEQDTAGKSQDDQEDFELYTHPGRPAPIASLKDDEAKILQHILELANNTREWLDFLGQSDYDFDIGKKLATDLEYANAYDVLTDAFRKVKGSTLSRDENTHFAPESMTFKLAVLSAGARSYSPTEIWHSYIEMAALHRALPCVTPSEIARRCKALWKTIVTRAPYLFLDQGDRKFPMRPPKHDHSFVVLLVMTVTPEQELTASLNGLVPPGQPSEIYNDRLTRLIEDLQEERYPNHRPSDVRKIWNRLHKSLQDAYAKLPIMPAATANSISNGESGMSATPVANLAENNGAMEQSPLALNAPSRGGKRKAPVGEEEHGRSRKAPKATFQLAQGDEVDVEDEVLVTG